MDYAIALRDTIVDEGIAAVGAAKSRPACPYMGHTDHAAAWLEGVLLASAAARHGAMAGMRLDVWVL